MCTYTHIYIYTGKSLPSFDIQDHGVYKLQHYDVLESLKPLSWKDVPNFLSQHDLIELELRVQEGEVMEC